MQRDGRARKDKRGTVGEKRVKKRDGLQIRNAVKRTGKRREERSI